MFYKLYICKVVVSDGWQMKTEIFEKFIDLFLDIDFFLIHFWNHLG
jgi:hypothetical protein